MSRFGARTRHSTSAGARRITYALAILSAIALARAARAQVIHGTVSSAVGAGRVGGAVVLLVDSGLTTHARALTSDSGTFAIGAGAPGRFHLKVMRIGFRPTESPVFDLQRDTTVDVALADIPVVLPAVTTRDRNDCRLHPDTTEAGLLTFALWDQARTAILAAAITLEQRDYRFAKLLHLRIYDVKQHALRDIALRETETRGTTPWTSLPAEQLRRDGYMAQDDSGMTFYAPDLDVLLSPYFTEEHCFHLATAAPPDSTLVGVDFEPPPAGRLRHVEIRGTLWLDAASK
ncbi:MAG TPA: carboxypeptidase-like regulatory domain-containing protein, partial [Gemmatimonadaceae bacterium]|nr:carboxypeptidase-like regulatory domain-containing protein [Gemmatimonadaceae bacterium]